MPLDSMLIFLLPLITSITTPIIKFSIFTLKHGWDIKNTFRAVSHGHMPSSHTAFVISALTSVGYYEGIDSGAFAVALVLAIIVIDDSVRLRVYMGDQGRFLNTLAQKISGEKENFPHLKERIGHRVSEVIVGGLFGFFFTLFLANLFSHIL